MTEQISLLEQAAVLTGAGDPTTVDVIERHGLLDHLQRPVAPSCTCIRDDTCSICKPRQAAPT